MEQENPTSQSAVENHKTEEATWESKEVIRHQYPQLFNEGNFDDEIFLKNEEL